MTAERLREAARVLRERAEAATPGPWTRQGDDIAMQCDLVAFTSPRDVTSDLDYIASMHPGVGLALAALIECDGSLGDTADHLEVIANLILGDAS